MRLVRGFVCVIYHFGCGEAVVLECRRVRVEVEFSLAG